MTPTELLNVVDVFGLLVEMEPVQASLLDRICSAALFDTSALLAAGGWRLAAGEFANAAGVQRRTRQAGTSASTARLKGFN